MSEKIQIRGGRDGETLRKDTRQARGCEDNAWKGRGRV